MEDNSALKKNGKETEAGKQRPSQRRRRKGQIGPTQFKMTKKLEDENTSFFLGWPT